MRLSAGITLAVFIIAVIACLIAAFRSKKALSNDVAIMLMALLPPMVGNFIIIASTDALVSAVGCYIFFIGIDFTVLAALRFVAKYCDIEYMRSKVHWVLIALVAIDAVQILLNPALGHVFDQVPMEVEGSLYYGFKPHIGLQIHRVIAYGIFFASLVVILIKTVRSPRIYREKYLVIAIVMIVAGAWQTYYILSGSPIDRSMIAFGAFGIAVFYFALFYKPMRLLDRMLARVIADMNEALFFFDLDGKCIYANAAGYRLFNFKSESDLAGVSKNVDVIMGDEQVDLDEEWVRMRTVGTGADALHYAVEFRSVVDDQGHKVGTALGIRDRTEEERNLQREKFLASHDSLTGLYNKDRFYREARALIDANPDLVFYAVAVDVKEFKIVNDIFSKEFGDKVLCEIADVLREHSHGYDVYGRLTGDKFGFIVRKDYFNHEAVERHLSTFKVVEGDVTYPIIMHQGIYEVTDPTLPVSMMFDRAFMAITSIKSDYQTHIAHYDESMRDDVIWNQRISSQLDRAMEEGQIRPYLQPLVDPEGNVEGAEVLVRWIHPEEGFLSPARFIPVFETNGMIAKLDTFIWDSACKILKDWERRSIDLFLSVNISPRDFYFIDVGETIRGLVERNGIDPSKLRLEITETVMMSDLENRLRIIDDLRSNGFLVEMDDFGSGYSSLNMLKDIPVDVLKIDMMFLYKTKDQVKAETILKSIINLSEELGIRSITEGVETADQFNMLVSMGCRMFQGYYFAKPMPLEEFESEYAIVA